MLQRKGLIMIGKCERCEREREIVARGLCGSCYKAFRRSPDFQYIDLNEKYTGKRYGKLVIIGATEKRGKNGGLIVSCKCDCGNTFETELKNIKEGGTKSCGCYQRECAANAWKQNIKFDERNGYFQSTCINHLTMKKPKTNTSGVKGVSFSKKHQKYEAYITIKRKRKHLGLFTNIEDARKARELAEEKYFEPVIEEFENYVKSNCD